MSKKIHREPSAVQLRFERGLRIGALIVGLYHLLMSIYRYYDEFNGRTLEYMDFVLLGALALCGGYLLYAAAQARCDWPAGSEDLSNITHGLKNAYTMTGALLGFFVVYFVDEKKLHFDVHAPFWGQVLKLVLGLALILGIKAGLKPVLLALFAGSQAESFVRYFAIVIFAGIVWPLTFPFFAKLGKKGTAA